ncbi:hypothetical protein OKW39_002384 [Paraburkholderia sp. MM6662-R1]
MGTLDLNALRTKVLANQLQQGSLPTDPNSLVVVDRDGTIVLGPDTKHGQPQTVVPRDVFA